MKRDSTNLLDAAVLLLVGSVVGVTVGVRADASTRPLALTLGLAAAAVLAFRRRLPTLTLVVSGGLVLALFAIDHAAGSIAVMAPAVALYTLALTRGRAHLVAAIVAAAAAVALAEVFLAGGHHTLTLQSAGHVALVAVPVLAAEALRNRRSYIQLLLRQLEHAERTREQEAERRAEQERLRIARELHDVVAHTLTTINVQAGVARHLLTRQPGHAEGALATIEAASHDALQELRAILGVLREPGDDRALLEPAPDLAAVEALIEQARSDGGEIAFEIKGRPPERIPDAVQLAAFRIVQESLTNSRRHAPGTPAAVTIAYGGDRIRLSVENPTVNGHSDNGGRQGGAGIVGMRERAAALGGTLQAGRSGGGFRVAAELPLPPGPMSRVLIADDQAAVRGGFAALISSEEDMEVVGEAADGREAVDLARRLLPQLVLMDVRMPNLDGLEATRLICADRSLADTRVLILTTFDLDEYVYRALRAGASGFLLKDAGPAELLHAIRTIVAGDALLAPSITKRLIAEFARRPDPATAATPAELGRLTEREHEILRLVAAGLSNGEIARSLVISPLTAKTHVGRILGKLGCRDRAQLVTLAYETGLVKPGRKDAPSA